MSLRINSEAPNFTTEMTQGVIDFHEWIGDGWVILFSHPKDFTPVCTTELGDMAGLQPEFDKRHCKIIGLSVDPVGNHARWAKDIEDSFASSADVPPSFEGFYSGCVGSLKPIVGRASVNTWHPWR